MYTLYIYIYICIHTPYIQHNILSLSLSLYIYIYICIYIHIYIYIYIYIYIHIHIWMPSCCASALDHCCARPPELMPAFKAETFLVFFAFSCLYFSFCLVYVVHCIIYCRLSFYLYVLASFRVECRDLVLIR